jgi:hypothetical protein
MWGPYSFASRKLIINKCKMDKSYKKGKDKDKEKQEKEEKEDFGVSTLSN